MSNVKLIKITKGVFNAYTKYVKNNKAETYISTRKKLHRNWNLAKVIEQDEEYECRRYGNLEMHMYKPTNRIVWLHNFRRVETEFDIDMDKKAELERELGLL